MRAFIALVLVGLMASTLACDEGSGSETAGPSRQSQQPVVYGEDDRRDVYDHPDEALRELARRSIVAMVPSDRLDDRDPEDIRILGDETLGQGLGLCEGQRFRDQPRLTGCSATLIDDDLVLTAGHCMSDQRDCDRNSFVFDVHYAAEGQLETISSDDVYSCARIVQTFPDGDLDHAIVQLDRPVVGDHGPAAVEILNDALQVGDEAVLIGFPSQIPAKIAAGGRVINSRAGIMDHFEATVDAFGGNSGSGVFNADGRLVGVLVRGEQDYRESGGCTVVNVLGEDRTARDGAEDITYVFHIIERLCAQGFDSPRLCGQEGRGWCHACASDEDCREGWSCGQWGGGDVTFCSAPCETSQDCRADHVCEEESGRCQPRREESCGEGGVYEVDLCGGGRPLSLVTPCEEGQFCESGRCVTQEEGNTCETAQTIEAVSQRLEGTLGERFSNNRRGSCGGDGPDRMLNFTLEEERTLVATMRGFDTVLHLRSRCDEGETELVCNDDISRRRDNNSRIEADLAPGDYTLILDAFNEDTGDGYELELEFGPVCDEECEPGQAVCRENAVLECVVDGRGCPVFDEPFECGELACVRGDCVVQGEGDRCEDASPLEPVSQTIEGDMREGYRDEHEGSCGGEGPERVFTFELEATARLEASVSGFDTVLYLRQSCDPQTELECNDDVNNPQDMGSAFSAELEAGRYFLFLDSFEDPEGYVLVLDFEAGCEDECFLGRSSCRDGGLRACTSSPEGCAVWGPVEQCAETEVCERGACQPLCEDECENPGGRVCSSEGGYRLCGLSPEGCASLSPVFECPGEDVCVEDGVCEPVVVSRAAPASDGCACSVGTSQPTSPWHLLWALIFFRRASRGGRRRQ